MKTPSPKLIYTMLRMLNWQGHVELGDSDLAWLAQELYVLFNVDGESDLCEVCDSIKPIVIKTTLGRICEDCLDAMDDEATELRELWEED